MFRSATLIKVRLVHTEKPAYIARELARGPSRIGLSSEHNRLHLRRTHFDISTLALLSGPNRVMNRQARIKRTKEKC